MDIVESINRYLAGSPVSKGERKRLTRARDEIMRLRTSPPRKPLTDEEIESCYEAARKTYRYSQSKVRGQQIMPSDGFDWHFARAIEAAHGITGEQK